MQEAWFHTESEDRGMISLYRVQGDFESVDEVIAKIEAFLQMYLPAEGYEHDMDWEDCIQALSWGDLGVQFAEETGLTIDAPQSERGLNALEVIYSVPSELDPIILEDEDA